MPLSDSQLLHYNRIGLIPGPAENIESFEARVSYCLTLQTHLAEELKTSPLGLGDNDPTILQRALDKLQRQYDVRPGWIPLFFSNHKLPFWHGGCAWIFQMSQDSPTAALIQLRNHLKNSEKYLGIYHRDELLTHEMVHVARMLFQEPRYEEILAYRTSNSQFRKFFGGLIQSSLESVIFLLALFLIVVFDVFLLATNSPQAYVMALWLKLIPFALLTYAGWRLYKRHKTLSACIANLRNCVTNKELAEAVCVRLKDEEIEEFSVMSPADIQAYAALHAEKELRWQVINKAYLWFRL